MKSIISVLCIVVFVCIFFSGCQELSDCAAGILDAKCDEIIDYFNEIALHSGINGKSIVRWEKPIHISITGDYTSEDYSCLTDFLDKLNMIEGMPEISIVDENANCYVYFLPIEKMYIYIPHYEEDDWWSYSTDRENNKIIRAYIGIATDVSTQKERNYMILKAVSKGIVFFKSSDKYPDSIFYTKWTEIQSLSKIDYELISMLYSPLLHAGMNEEQAEEALRPLVKEKYLSLD